MSQGVRVLISIGCDTYSHLSDLGGAELDADNIYKLLTSGTTASYDVEHSKLLLSPTSTGLMESLDDLSKYGTIDTLTIFFAGHGGVSHGSYYLCTKDSEVGRFATSATSLSRIFELINERAPNQCNIILDSCQSGGLIGDLGTLLKPEILGMSSSPGISIFATSASNEYSADTAAGGVGTNHLLKALTGESVLQARTKYLDLVEIGRHAAVGIYEESAQSPVVWGLNLFGLSRFVLNPHYKSEDSFEETYAIGRHSNAGIEISKYSDDIWQLYFSPASELTPEKIYSTLAPITKSIDDLGDTAQFVKGILTTLSAKVEESDDSFSLVTLIATCISLLQDKSASEGEVQLQLRGMFEQLSGELRRVLAETNEGLKQNAYFLTANGLADFYYLPLRISKLLGWLGALGIINSDPIIKDEIEAIGLELLSHIKLTYTENLVYLNDEQTCYLLTFFSVASSNPWREAAEEIFGFYFSDFLRTKGNIAGQEIKANQTLQVIRSRSEDNQELMAEVKSTSSESLSMLLLVSNLLSLNEQVDPYLKELDHVVHLIFIPDSYLHFNRKVIEEGLNHTFQIGHNVWVVDDLTIRWNEVCVKQFEKDESLKSDFTKLGALCCALIYPNRVPWFLLNSNS